MEGKRVIVSSALGAGPMPGMVGQDRHISRPVRWRSVVLRSPWYGKEAGLGHMSASPY